MTPKGRALRLVALLAAALPGLEAINLFERASSLFSSFTGSAQNAETGPEPALHIPPQAIQQLAAPPAISSDAAQPPVTMSSFEITMPVEGLRLIGDRTPLQITLESADDLRPFEDACQVTIEDPDAVQSVTLPLRNLLPPYRFGLHASLPVFYDAEPECVAEVCYRPTLLPGPRRLSARLECASDPSGAQNASSPLTLVATHEVTFLVSPARPTLEEDALATLPFFREGSSEPLPMRVDWALGDEVQAREYCEGTAGRTGGEGLEACVGMVACAVAVSKRERLASLGVGLLDHLMAAGIDILDIEGCTFDHAEKMELMRRVVREPHVRRVCEIGFNAGHSVLLWLLYGHPELKVTAFDLANHPYPPHAVEWLLKRFGPRLEVVMGTSVETVPAYAAMHPDVACDVLFIDGGHFGEVPLRDLQNMRLLANRTRHVVLLDDAEFSDVRPAKEAIVAEGRMVVDEVVSSQSAPTVFQTESAEGKPPQWHVVWNFGHVSEVAVGRYLFDVKEVA